MTFLNSNQLKAFRDMFCTTIEQSKTRRIYLRLSLVLLRLPPPTWMWAQSNLLSRPPRLDRGRKTEGVQFIFVITLKSKIYLCTLQKTNKHLLDGVRVNLSLAFFKPGKFFLKLFLDHPVLLINPILNTVTSVLYDHFGLA